MYITGIDPTDVDASPKHLLGSLGANSTSEGTKVYMYVRAGTGGITGDGYVAVIDGSSFVADMVTTSAAAPGTGFSKSVGVARAAIPANNCGWVQVYGAGAIRVAASTAAYTRLNTTTTAGQLDAAGTAGSRQIASMALDVAQGGAAGNAAGWMSWPFISVTL